MIRLRYFKIHVFYINLKNTPVCYEKLQYYSQIPFIFFTLNNFVVANSSKRATNHEYSFQPKTSGILFFFVCLFFYVGLQVAETHSSK